MASKETKKNPKLSPQPTQPSQEPEPTAPTEPLNRDHGLLIVGIGTSAGGLKALERFFTALPTDTGMAFVVITHLHPEYESHMAELLQQFTAMPAIQVTEKVKVEGNHVYVIAPGRKIHLTDSHLDVSEFDEPHGKRMPVDHFFRSLAASGHRDPVAIILSGTGTDGSVGIKDVKEAGGLVLVQQPEDAEYDGMPRAALTTGIVDVSLPASQLAAKLTSFHRHLPLVPHVTTQLSETDMEVLQRILAQVHARTGHDFSQYKHSTLLRRVERRMQLNGFPSMDAYLDYMRGNSTETHALFNDILIGVTNFFRDRDAWTALEREVIPELFRHNRDRNSDGVRVWSIGCATGEEAYGIAMLMFEEAARQEVRAHIQVFASDLDERSIAHAREGFYPAAIEADVSPERLERFFIREGEYYRIKREVREVVLFTSHNIMRDPPFSRQDLIACRNVLIYLQRSVQDRVFDIFHYSLNPGGYLFLGSSESAEHLPDLFAVVDKAHRLYKARPWLGDRAHVPAMPMTLHRGAPRMRGDGSAVIRPTGNRYTDEPLVLEDQHKKTLESYSPPSVLINERYIVLHVSESAGRYLFQPKGPITGDLLSLVRPELQVEVRTALFHAFEKGKATISRPVTVQFDGQRRVVVIAVRPRPAPSPDSGAERQALVLFIEDEVLDPDQVDEAGLAVRTPAERDQMLAQLQAEIQRLREQLQLTIEEYDSSNEEMKAANEELQSMNEEYRSATEELETSKEELQSVNEELQTVNTEMRNKLEEVSLSRQELENLMGATEIATLYLDRELRIQRYTAGVQELFNVLNVDRGRKISDITHRLNYEQVVDDAAQVLRHLIPVEREIQRTDGTWFLMRLHPYRTREDYIEGVVITFIDISQLKATEQELYAAKSMLEEHVEERTRELAQANERIRQARDMFFTLFHSNPIPTSLTQLEDGTFLNVNDAYLEFSGLQREKVLGHTAQELGLPIAQSLRPEVISQVKNEGMIRNLEFQLQRASGEIATVLASIQLLSFDQTQTLLLAFIDITERVQAEQQIRSLAYDLTMAEQEERRRISQILHDDLQQRIFAVKMQIAALQDAYEKADSQPVPLDFGQLENWLDESISITRNLSIDLSPAILQGDGLTDALVWLAAQMEKQYGLQVTLKSNGIVGRYEDTLRILLFQAVRESLFNVVKHSHTREARIDMAHVDNHTELVISDEGMGFDAESVLAGSKTASGLLNLQHRLDLMGCHLQVKSQPNVQGNQVVITIPFDK